MNRFSRTSAARLATCHPDLQAVMEQALQVCDCTILCGYRNESEQNALFSEGKSQLHYPKGRHNASPSLAVDVAPYPIDWHDRERFSYFAGVVIGIGASMGIAIRWGGDWDGDFDLKDNNFDDLVHFELRL